MPITTRNKAKPIENSLVVCAGSVSCRTVEEMGAGFNMFKTLFAEDHLWPTVLQQNLTAYHQQRAPMPAYQLLAEANGLRGGVATVPVYHGSDLHPGSVIPQEEQYKAAVRGAVQSAQRINCPLFIQPLGIGVYGWPPEVAAALFADVFKEEDPEGILDITVNIFDIRPNSNDMRFADALNEHMQPLVQPSQTQTSRPQAPVFLGDTASQSSLSAAQAQTAHTTAIGLIHQFYGTHRQLQANKHFFYRWFICSHWSNSHKATTLEEIMSHAMNDRTLLGYRNRSFETCIQLGWLQEREGRVELAKGAPNQVQNAYNAIIEPSATPTPS